MALKKNSKKHIYFFIGTTAEFIKLAPIIKELKKRKIKFKLITSGQNKILFEEFKKYLGPIKADISFKEKGAKPSPFYFGVWASKTLISGIFSLRKEFKNLNKNSSYLIVHGDTASSFIGVFIASFYGLKIIHIESGLRSFNFFEPFPEELFRYLNMKLANVLFCPNEWSTNNVAGWKKEIVNTKENTLIESCRWALNTGKKSKQNFGKYYILYIRRQEHIYFRKNWTKKIINKIIQNADPELNCLFTKNILNWEFVPKLKGSLKKRFITVPKIPYVDFMNLMNNAEFIATDGCTNQEEAYYMGLPLLALRHRTERIEGLGKNVVISKGDNKIIKAFLKNYKEYRRKPVQIRERPSKIIVDYLLKS